MFVCGFCKTQQPQMSKPIKVVVETRKREYPHDHGARVTVGSEIVREVDSCGGCALKQKF